MICLRGPDGQPEYRIFVGGKLHPAAWRDKGPAEAGLVVEKKRAAKAAKKKAPTSRPERWADACGRARVAYDQLEELLGEIDGAISDLRDLKQEYEDWKDNMPESFQSGPTGEKLEEVASLELDSDATDMTTSDLGELIDACENIDLPRGFGKD